MSAEVWYRKWRPQSFAEITGQEHVTRTLANAVARKRVSHAYLLCGPRGTGKTTTARVLAKAVNCERPQAGEPCNACSSCIAVIEGRALDLVEMDAASNRGIDDIRNLRDRVGYHPSSGSYRVYLIDEVHELTAQAFDALLKTLEEPPPHIIFVLATTDAHRVPATITSRCQRFDLTRITASDVVSRLATIAAGEGLDAEPGALEVIARAATGSLRDGVNLLEQLASTYGATLTEAQAREGLGLIADGRAREVAVLAAGGDFVQGAERIAAVQEDGVDMRRFAREVVAQLRALMLVKAGVSAGLEGHSGEALAELRRAADDLDARRVLKALKAFSSVEFRGEAHPALPLELALAEVCFAPEPQPTPAPERPAAVAPAPRPSMGRPLPTPMVLPPRGVSPAPVNDAAVGAAPPAPEPVSSAAMNGAHHEPADAEPAFSPAGAPIAEPPSGPLTLDEARSRYREVYETCRSAAVKEGKMVGAVLNSGCDFVAVDERSITLGVKFPHLLDKILPGTQLHRVLSSTIDQVLGRRLELRCVHMENVEDRLRKMPARPSHLLDEAMKLGLPRIDR